MHRSRLLLLSLVSSVGLTLVCLCMLGGGPARAAPGDVITVCLGAGCDHQSLQDAVDAASGGELIKVAAGVYDAVHQRGSLTQVLYVSTTVAVRGGYTTTDDFADPPDPDTHLTTLDANGLGRGIVVTGGADVQLSGLNVVSGWVDGSGGGIFAANASLVISDCRIAHNEAAGYGSGGGIYVRGTTATLSGNEIADNRSFDEGGGVAIDDSVAVILEGNEIHRNATSNRGGGLSLRRTDGAMLVRNRIFENGAERGGGVSLRDAQGVALRANQLYRNLSAKRGGGLHLEDAHATMTNTLLVDNFANSGGAGLYATGATAHLLHATVARNLGHHGIYLENGSAVWLTNAIVVSHTVGVEAHAASTATLDTTLWGAGAWANVTDTVAAQGGAVIVAADLWGDPAFVAPGDPLTPGDPFRISPDPGDYHITRTSAALDVGTDTAVHTDLDGDPRPVGGGYDVGADEYVGCLARLNAGTIYTTVQAAIDASGSPTDVVRVAGTCYEHDVTLNKTLALRGGWSGDFSVHDPQVHLTTLDAQGQGRVLHVTAGSPLVEDLHIINGSLSNQDGAGVLVRSTASATLRHNHFYFNATGGQGGAICVDGSPEVTLEANQIYSNLSGGSGGGVYVRSADARLVDNAIYGNATSNVSNGGGVAIGNHAVATLERNTITGNTAHRNGGGLSVGDRTDTTLINNVIADNSCCASSGWMGAAGIWLGSGDHVLIHNTIADNSGGDGAAIRLYGDAALTNTIIANHGVGLMVAQAGDTATLEGTLWYSNAYDLAGTGTALTGTVDLHANPRFVQPGRDDYHLQADSPAVDAGVLSGVPADVDGEPRPRGQGYDIGADEYPAAMPDAQAYVYLPFVLRTD